MNDTFDNSGSGKQNIAIGENAIAEQNNYGISPEVFAEYAGKLAVTEAALASFFTILEEQQVRPGDLDSKLREIAGQYRELLARLETVQSEDQEVRRLKDEARQAIEAGKYAEAEELLNQAEARDVQAIEELEQATRQRRISAAASCADNAMLQRMQYRYAKAAEYWKKAAFLLPQESRKEQAGYLNSAGRDLKLIARYSEALPLFEQSLAIRQDIGDRRGEGGTLNNIGLIYKAWGNYTIALPFFEQSLIIRREIGNKRGEGKTLNNIGLIYKAQSNYAAALPLYKQSLAIRREIGDLFGEARCLNNIGLIYKAWGDYDNALLYYDQSLSIRREIGDKAGEGSTLNNIGLIYNDQHDYAAALPLFEQSLAIRREIEDRRGEGRSLDNIGHLYNAQGHYDKAFEYLKQSLAIRREIGDKSGEGATLNNIGLIYNDQHDYAAALPLFEQSLAIRQNIGDRRGEAETSWNIGRTYEDQGDLAKAEPYMSRAVQLAEEIGHPELEKYRKGLERVRAALQGRFANRPCKIRHDSMAGRGKKSFAPCCVLRYAPAHTLCMPGRMFSGQRVLDRSRSAL